MSLNVITVQTTKNQFLKNQCSGTHWRGFQFLPILDLLGIRFHAVVVFGLGKNLLFESILGRCEQLRNKVKTFLIYTFGKSTLCTLQAKAEYSVQCNAGA